MHAELRHHLYTARRQAAELRQRLRQRRRHPLPEQGEHAGRREGHGQHRAVGRGRIERGRGAGAARAHGRRGAAVQPAPHHAGGRRRGAAEAQGGASVLCVGAGGLGSPASLYLAAAGVGTLGLIDFDTVDFSNLQRQVLYSTERRRPAEAAGGGRTGCTASIRTSRSSAHETMLNSANALEIFKRLRHHRRRRGQLPDAVPRERRVRAARQAERLRQHLPLRRPGLDLRDEERAVLPLPLSRAATARPRAELRRRRRPRCAAGGRRHDPGDRGDQAHHRRRRSADRPAAAVRCPADALPRAEAAEGSRVPGVRRQPDRDQAHRLRAVLRHHAGGEGRRPGHVAPELESHGRRPEGAARPAATCSCSTSASPASSTSRASRAPC